MSSTPLVIYKFAELLVKIDESETLQFMAFAPGELLPVAMLKLDMTEPAGYVMSLWVAEQHRCRGLATALLSRAEARTLADDKETIGLSVHADNGNAKRLYASLGYRRYTSGHEQYTQMVKQLK